VNDILRSPIMWSFLHLLDTLNGILMHQTRGPRVATAILRACTRDWRGQE